MIDLLVIEPSMAVRKTLERLLESHGYTMRGVTRAADALLQIGRHRPDLVLCEVQLPDISGLELCQQLWLTGLPVVLMGSEIDEGLRQASRDAGAVELLGKPLSDRELLRSLAHHLQLPAPSAPPKVTPLPTLLSTLMTRPGLLGAGIYSAQGTALEEIGAAIPVPLFQSFLNPPAPLHSSPEAAGSPPSAALGSCPQNQPPQSHTRSLAFPLASPLERTRVLDAPPPTTAFPTNTLLCAQLEYPDHCLLLFRLPGEVPTTLVCLIQHSSYASLVKYYLRSSPYIRL